MPASTSVMAVTPARTSAVPRSGWPTMRQDEDQGHDDAAQQRVLPVAHLVEPVVQEPGEEQDQHGFGDLRRLEGEEAAEADPAMGVVRVAEEEDHDQQERGDAERGIDEARRVVAAVVDAHERHHGEHAEQRPQRLLADEGVGRVGPLLATTAEAEKTMTRPATTSSSVVKNIHLSTPTRFAIPSIPAPLQQALEDAAAVFVVFKLVEAGAGGGEQDHVARTRGGGGGADGFVERFAGVDGDDAAQLGLDFCAAEPMV